jgi:heptosyltransferase I
MFNTNSPPSSICLFRLSAIGDVCHTLPVLRTLQATWPKTKITWIIGKLEASLIGDVENVEFIIFDKKLGRKAYSQLKQDLKGREFDVLLMMQVAIRASLASRLIKAKYKIGFDRARAKDFQWLFSQIKILAHPDQHVMQGLFGFTQALGIKHRVVDWKIPLSNDALLFAEKHITSSQTILISPCSTERKNNFRNWSSSNYAAICDYLDTRGYKVILTGGPSELEKQYGTEIEAQASSEILNLIGKTDLKQLYALICKVKGVIAPDSGPVHMANSAKTACIGLYASSNPLRTGPYHYQQLVVNKYPEAVEKFLHKTTDSVKWGQRVRNSEVMNLIKVNDVIEKIDLII